MKRTNILGFIFIITIMAFGFSAVEAQTSKIKTWKITVSQSGGLAGIRKTFTLDNDGNLNRVNKDQQSFEKIEESRIGELGKLIKELNLPRTKLKTVKGIRIYDGIYSGLTINLNGKDYNVEGSSFDDAKFSALNAKQKVTLEKLKKQLAEFNIFLPDGTTNKMN